MSNVLWNFYRTLAIYTSSFCVATTVEIEYYSPYRELSYQRSHWKHVTKQWERDAWYIVWVHHRSFLLFFTLIHWNKHCNNIAGTQKKCWMNWIFCFTSIIPIQFQCGLHVYSTPHLKYGRSTMSLTRLPGKWCNYRRSDGSVEPCNKIFTTILLCSSVNYNAA